MSSSASRAGKCSAWSNRFSCTSSRTTSAKTSLQSRAAQKDKLALSSPQGETIPPVRTSESRNRRIRRVLLTPDDAREGIDVDLSVWSDSSCSGEQKVVFVLPAASPKLLQA